MSALGHVLFLLPFLRDFARSGCIASFLKARVLAGGITRHGGTSRRELFMQSSTHRGHTLRGHTLRGHTLRGHTLRGHTLRGHTL